MQLAAETMEDVVAQARAWNRLSEVQERQGEYRASLSSATHAERLIRTVEAFEGTLPLPAQRELARALVRKGWTLYRLGRAAAALAMGEQALHLSNELGKDDLPGQALAMNLLGVVQRRLGRYQQAQHYQERALALYRALGEREREAMVLNNLGVSSIAVGDYPRAVELCEQALAIHREIGNRQGEMLALSNLSGAQVGMKDYATAESTLRQMIRLPESTGWFLALTYRFLAEACLGLGKLAEAQEAAQRSLELAQETGEQVYTGMAWRTLGMVLAHPNSPAEGEGSAPSPTACFTFSHDIFMEMGGEGERARTLREWARYELAQGEPLRGKVLWRDARALFERLGMEREAEAMKREEEDGEP
jgi:tetratricopeptide (TPR) repeat protein